MLAVFAMNTLGFYGVFLGVQAVQTEITSKKIDEEVFSGSQTLTFRIPLKVPYHTDDSEYAQVDGQFENNGEVYRLVKQKLLRDTLYIVCLKDTDSKKINQELTDYVKTFSDSHDSSKHSNAKKVVAPISEYTLMSIGLITQQNGWVKSIEFNEFIHEESTNATVDIILPPRLFSLS